MLAVIWRGCSESEESHAGDALVLVASSALSASS